MTFGDHPSFFTSYNKRYVTTWMWKALHLNDKTLLALHAKVLVEILLVPSHQIPSSESKGTQFIYAQELLSWSCELARDEAYSREVLLQPCGTPCLTKRITTHDSHTVFLFLICQAQKQKLNQIGIKTAIPPEFAYYILDAHFISKWEYNLRWKLLTPCRPDSNFADLMETMSH